MGTSFNDEELPPLTTEDVPSPEDVRSGPYVSPAQRVTLYSATEWESFVTEWAHTLTDRYVRVRQLGGAGDQGRDIVGYTAPTVDSPRDVYQCKHYSAPLMPSDVWIELGKVCWHTYKKHYPVPHRYYFVSPRGTGTSLSNLIEQPDELRSRLIDEWEDKCTKRITKAQSVQLKGHLRKYVDSFDFSIFDDVSPSELIRQHKQSPRHLARFGGSLPSLGQAPVPPTKIGPEETNYVARLLSAYAEHTQAKIECSIDIPEGHPCESHFRRSRQAFYDAEFLRAMSREQLGAAAYPALLDNVFDGICDVVDSDHVDGFARVKAATQAAAALQLTADPHETRLTPRRRMGTCHQLANNERVCWKKKK